MEFYYSLKKFYIMLFFTAYDIVQLNIKQLLLDLKADIEAGFVIVKVVDWWIAEPVKTDDNSLRNAQTTLDCSNEVSRYTITQKTQKSRSGITWIQWNQTV